MTELYEPVRDYIKKRIKCIEEDDEQVYDENQEPQIFTSNDVIRELVWVLDLLKRTYSKVHVELEP